MKLITILIAVSITLAALIYGYTTYVEKDEEPQVDLFFPSENVMGDVDSTLAKAKAEGKLALLILGADWCHDSQGIANRIQDPALKAILDEKYETRLIDVELFEHGQDVVKRFGQPTIIATPTILIINPETEKLVNSHNMHQWRDADKISLDDTIKYFADMSDSKNHMLDLTSSTNVEYNRLIAEIDAFENKHAARIEHAFTNILAPYLALGKDELGEEFFGKWVQVRTLRYTITDNMAKLRKEALERVFLGEENITLTYPDYKAFAWE